MLRVSHITKSFYRGMFPPIRVRAVHDVGFSIQKGETLGLVGESGCGKSTLSRIIMGLIPPDHGTILLGNKTISRLKGGALRNVRRKIQIVFQNPFSSFDPLRKVKQSLLEPLIIHGAMPSDHEGRLREVTHNVGLPFEIMDRYPHQVSGGELQRAAIARALILNPDVLILDEPTSMLDVSIQATILNLLKTIQNASKVSFLFISHDPAVVAFMSDTIAVMKKGELLEIGTKNQIFTNPENEYTRRLLEQSL